MEKVLAIDDSQLSLKLLTQTLEAHGFTAIYSNEAHKAHTLARTERPAIILLDIVMPEMSGLEVLAKLKADTETEYIPVIMVTSRTDAVDVERALDTGAFDYIRKPFEPVEIMARLRSALRIRDYQERLRYLSTHDGLTGLLNHVEILSCLARELGTIKAEKQPLAVAMIDIDYFKKVNDTNGHQAGDTVLSGLGSLIQSAFGDLGKAGRYGGEEFLLVIRNYTRTMAEHSLEAFRKMLENHDWKFGGRTFRITISIGVSACEQGGAMTPDQLVNKADAALYAAKESGRNRIVTM